MLLYYYWQVQARAKSLISRVFEDTATFRLPQHIVGSALGSLSCALYKRAGSTTAGILEGYAEFLDNKRTVTFQEDLSSFLIHGDKAQQEVAIITKNNKQRKILWTRIRSPRPQ